MQDQADGEWGALASNTLLKWIPRCITGLTDWAPARETSGNTCNLDQNPTDSGPLSSFTFIIYNYHIWFVRVQ